MKADDDDGVEEPEVEPCPATGGVLPADTHGRGAMALVAAGAEAAADGVQLGVNGAPEMNGCSLACVGVHRRCGSNCNRPCRKWMKQFRDCRSAIPKRDIHSRIVSGTSEPSLRCALRSRVTHTSLQLRARKAFSIVVVQDEALERRAREVPLGLGDLGVVFLSHAANQEASVHTMMIMRYPDVRERERERERVRTRAHCSSLLRR